MMTASSIEKIGDLESALTYLSERVPENEMVGVQKDNVNPSLVNLHAVSRGGRLQYYGCNLLGFLWAEYPHHGQPRPVEGNNFAGAPPARDLARRSSTAYPFPQQQASSLHSMMTQARLEHDYYASLQREPMHPTDIEPGIETWVSRQPLLQGRPALACRLVLAGSHTHLRVLIYLFCVVLCVCYVYVCVCR